VVAKSDISLLQGEATYFGRLGIRSSEGKNL